MTPAARTPFIWQTYRLNNTVTNADSGNRYRLFLPALCLSYAVIQAALIPTFPLTYDDGLNLQVSRLINQGYEPYTQIFTLAGPLFVWFVGWLGGFGLSPTGFKLVFLLFGVLLLVNISIIAQTLLGRKVAVATVFLLATATTFLAEAATTIVAVTPALSIATLSLVLILRYSGPKQSIRLLLSGAVWGVALFLSISVLTIGLVAVIFILFLNSDIPFSSGPIRDPVIVKVTDADRKTLTVLKTFRVFIKRIPLALKRQNIYKSIGIWLAGVLISLGIGILIATPDIIFGHLLKDYATLKQNLALIQEINFISVGQFVAFNLWLFLFGAYALTRIHEEPNHPLWIILIWSLLSFCWLMLQVTLRMVDIAIILPPVAMMAGWGVVDIVRRLIHRSRNRQGSDSRQRLWWVGASLFLLGLYLWVSRQQVNTFNLRGIDTQDDLIQLEQRQEITTFIQQHTAPDDCVIIDDAALAIAANRLPAPQLVELSKERIASGLITEATIKTLAQKYECQAVVFSKRKYTRPLSDFRKWAGAYYPHRQEFTRTRIYYQ